MDQNPDFVLIPIFFFHLLFIVNPNKVVIEQWGQRDSNPRPPAPRAYTQNWMVSCQARR